MRRVIEIGVPAREKLAAGAKRMADAVGGTLGPWGNNWFLDKKNSITNDGVTIARELQFEDEVENRGAAAIREAAIKTVDEVGDGTSTAIVLAYQIYDRASHYLGDDTIKGKKTPAEVVRQIERERLEITDKLKDMATPIETIEQLIDSAKVAVEDEELGMIIGKAQWEVGRNGYLLAEETAERVSSVERIHGIRIDNGFGTSQVINNQEKQSLELEEIAVLLTSHTMKDIFRINAQGAVGPGKDWEAIMKIAGDLGRDGRTSLVVIARAWTDEGIQVCLQNINQGAIKIYPLSAPYVDMQERFKDLAAVLGAKFYDSENSRLRDLALSDLGFASKVVARRYDAILAGKDDDWTKERVDARVKELQEQLAGSQSDFEKKTLSERIAQLQNGFAIVKVGSPSDMERRRLFDKCEDAVHAVRAAFQEGTVPGAGKALYDIAQTLPDDSLLKHPIMEPYKLIMASAPEGFVVEDWVRDPVKVMRVALEKACAAAASFATAGGVVTEKKPKELDELLRGK